MSQRQQELKQLESHCDTLLAEITDGHGSKPRIAAWGLVKAGKSSLLNMLAGHVTDEYFKTGPIRTTRINSELEKDNYILVDTPGLGIDQDDSKQAFKGLDGADVILFVHSPQGELDQEEIDLLIQVKKAYKEETEQRLILVLSQLDKDQGGALDAITERITEQLQKYIGIKPICFQVSNSRYQKGVAEKKSTMVKKSGIPELALHLETLSQQIKDRLESVRQSRQQIRKVELVKQLDEAIKNELQLISTLKSPYIEKVATFNNMMAQFKKDFSSYSAQIKAVQKEINNI